ncbi:DUF4403 family protein [Gramella sp. AN32]|uniref:DUF4403 family protein n=1 Tax=Christiangramia antarctica TaxID=2058158 RepID=A0ABW5X552_9FLAO|nr:DUF4403 family protein [Gramella sp. AN32]MCM4156692.1 hypothetical protein [Gramella sp. AN32]
MNSEESITPSNLQLLLPIQIEFDALEKVIQSKLIGEIIEKENEDGTSKRYAEITNVNLETSELEQFDIILVVEFITLTSLFKNKKATALIHASLALSQADQRVFIEDYLIEMITKNFLADALLENIANNWMYAKIKSKMNFDFLPQIESRIVEINDKLEKRIETMAGIYILGSIEQMKIVSLEVLNKQIHLKVQIIGDIGVNVNSIDLPV